MQRLAAMGKRGGFTTLMISGGMSACVWGAGVGIRGGREARLGTRGVGVGIKGAGGGVNGTVEIPEESREAVEDSGG